MEVGYETGPLIDAVADQDDELIDSYVTTIEDLVAFLYEGVSQRPEFVYALSNPHLDRVAGDELSLPVVGTDTNNEILRYTCWLMLFPPAMVDQYGRDRINTVDVYSRHELTDGAILLVVYDSPTRTGETQHIDEALGLDSPEVGSDKLAY